MRNIIYYVLASLIPLSACHSRKAEAIHAAIDVDAVARSAQIRSLLSVDSLIRHIELSFDSVDIRIESPAETISLKAVNGHISDRMKKERYLVDTALRSASDSCRMISEENSRSDSTTSSGHFSFILFLLLCLVPFFIFMIARFVVRSSIS